MRRLHGQLRLMVIVGCVAIFSAACDPGVIPDDGLARDLELASSTGGLGLSPTTGRVEVVSAIERSPRAKPAQVQQSIAPYRTPPSSAVATPTAAAPDPAPVAEDVRPPAAVHGPVLVPRPVPVPQQTPPPGGYKTVEEIIRDAPFPINP